MGVRNCVYYSNSTENHSVLMVASSLTNFHTYTCYTLAICLKASTSMDYTVPFFFDCQSGMKMEKLVRATDKCLQPLSGSDGLCLV